MSYSEIISLTIKKDSCTAGIARRCYQLLKLKEVIKSFHLNEDFQFKTESHYLSIDSIQILFTLLQ